MDKECIKCPFLKKSGLKDYSFFCSQSRLGHNGCGGRGVHLKSAVIYEIEVLEPSHPTYRAGMGGMKQVIVSKHHGEIHALVAHFFGGRAEINAQEFVKWRTTTSRVSIVGT